MKLLLTSNGITNTSISDALVGLLGRSIAESSALFIPTAIYPFPGGPTMAWEAASGKSRSPLCQLGWKSLGLLELTALSSIEANVWLAAIEQADALLVWGGDPLYLAYWLLESGLAGLLPTLLRKLVYVGVSAGSMAVSSTFGETYSAPRSGMGTPLSSQTMLFATPQGEISRSLVTARGAGLVDFAVIPHLNNANHPDASIINAERWAASLPVPVYAIDDQTAIRVVDGTIEVVSEGRWKLFA